MTKRDAYQELVACRKRCSRCPGLTNPASKELQALDSDEIGPYTCWHGDLNARLVVVGKDFAPVAKFEQYNGRPGVDVETNRRLVNYLKIAGFEPGAIDRSHHDGGMFFTNAVLCLPGGAHMRTKILSRDVKTCSVFLKKTLSIVSPRVVATLGGQATNAVLHAHGLPRGDFSALVKMKAGFELPDGATTGSIWGQPSEQFRARLFAMPHPVASFSKSVHEAAWRRLRVWFKGR